MADDPKKQPDVLQINTGDEMLRGRFSNNLLLTHTREEFILDWLLTSHSGVQLVSRIIVTPGHAKRMLEALRDNLAKYERQFGEIRSVESKDPVMQ